MKKFMTKLILTTILVLGLGSEHTAYAAIDFDSIPLSPISYGEYNYHEWGAVMDGDNIALVVDMNANGKNPGYDFQGYGYIFKLADQQVSVDINDASQVPHELGASADVTFKVSNYGTNTTNYVTGKIYVREAPLDTTTQVLNLEIPISSMVADPSLVTDINITNPNLGDQSLIVSGASTVPLVSAGIGAVIAIGLSVTLYRNRRRNVA